VVAHQTAGVNLPARFSARLGQSFDEILPVHIIKENVLASIAATHHMTDRPRIFNPQPPWHGTICTSFLMLLSTRFNEPCYGLTPMSVGFRLAAVPVP
jgi:hypothetical protein